MKKNKNILLVEDDKSIRESMIWLLNLYGYTVTPAINGLDALKKLRSVDKPALIFIDLLMPIMDGFSFREKQKNDPDLCTIPTIIISASTESERIKLFPNEKFFPKPFDTADLISLMESCCE